MQARKLVLSAQILGDHSGDNSYVDVFGYDIMEFGKSVLIFLGYILPLS
jgi:hypothetical protein